jgi:hypothetical protein
LNGFKKCDNFTFYGNKYTTIIAYITDYNLYDDLHMDDVFYIYHKLNTFIFENSDELKNNKSIDIRNYCQFYSYVSYGDFITDLKILENLRDYFKICKDNNLYLLSSYTKGV